jgi:hypothetical protein
MESRELSRDRDDEETDMGCIAIAGSLVSIGVRLDRLSFQCGTGGHFTFHSPRRRSAVDRGVVVLDFAASIVEKREFANRFPPWTPDT